MNLEQARFNMIEQQIRPWDVLDPAVLELLSIVKREDFVPPAQRADAPAARGELGPERNDGGRISRVSLPTLTVVPPAVDRANGTAVIICPGGGYGFLSMAREGAQYATWLSTLGITSFILKSRLEDWGHPAPLQDVLRAIRLLRSRAAEFGIDPQRIGLIGSSAGGHLAASASTLYDHPAGRTGHALDAVNARPDFAILLYPVITLHDPAAHAGSRTALLGSQPSSAELALMSLEQQVSPTTPELPSRSIPRQAGATETEAGHGAQAAGCTSRARGRSRCQGQGWR
jgi:acetyl esterase/lipase